ncbi:sensor histidine kinase [Tropicibacter alexandrii]|uniref:sensor histidine kinase n=1 Tax=Tropicibacter alexandrii TaxID=2267683 RepID=UPI000EF4512E|nr:sensor histidine kinase [Tropicibacter alexandrii]
MPPTPPDETLLVAEMRHRMANGFQLLQAFARQQLRTCETQEAKDCVGRVLSQIESITSLQLALSQADRGAFGAFLDQIEPHWKHLGAGQGVEITLNHDAPRHLPVRVAENAARILMEAITNALEHAFPEHEGGRVAIEVSMSDGGFMQLQVADDGVGLRGEPGDGQGTGIIAALARDLGGEAQWHPGEPGGCTLSVRFPINPDCDMMVQGGVHMTS